MGAPVSETPLLPMLASLLQLFLHPAVDLGVALFFFIMAGYLAGRFGSYGRTILWLTPSLWVLLAIWNGITKGAIRVDLFLTLPLLLGLSLCSVCLLLLAMLLPATGDDGPE